MANHVHKWKPEMYSRGAFCNQDGCTERLGPQQVEDMLNIAEILSAEQASDLAEFLDSFVKWFDGGDAGNSSRTLRAYAQAMG